METSGCLNPGRFQALTGPEMADVSFVAGVLPLKYTLPVRVRHKQSGITHVKTNSLHIVQLMFAAGFLCSLVAGCSAGEGGADSGLDAGAADSGSESLEPFRFAVISDTHVYPSVDFANSVRFSDTGTLLSGLKPPLSMVFDTGDNIQDLFAVYEEVAAGAKVEAIETYKTLIAKKYKLPYYIVLGNHDDRFYDVFKGLDVPKAAWHKAFAGTESLPENYYTVDHNGFTLIVLDSTDLATDHATNDEPTFGAGQLNWLETQLSRGRPSILFWHHWIEPADAQVDANPILSVIKRHGGTVRAAFTGHGHVFRKVQWEGVQFFETAALCETAAPRYHLVEANPKDGTFRIINEGDIVYEDQ
jgi:3',5'-cyclic AMP phosphodiesterase CpdA